MHYLIDGHNLIGKLPDVSLGDDQDEFELAMRLKSWSSASRKRQVTVVFDKGMPGGTSRMLSNRDVTAVFAPRHTNADTLLISRIKKVKNPPEYTLVSSDEAIIKVAKKRRMPFIRSEDFVEEHMEMDVRLIIHKEPEEVTEKPDTDSISDAEVDEWLRLFGPVKPRPKPKPKPRKKATPAAAPKKEEPAKPKKRQPLTVAKAGNRDLDEEEVAEWLAIFGEVEEKRPSRPTTGELKESIPKPKKKRRKPNVRTSKTDNVKLSNDEVDDWLDIFGRG